MLAAPVPATLAAGAYTLARLQPRQLLGMGLRHAREEILPRLPVDYDRWYDRQIPTSISTNQAPVAANTAVLRESLAADTRERYARRAAEAAGGAPTFMNRTLRIAEGADVDWFDPRLAELPALWRLQLYSFQPLRWLVASTPPSSRPDLQATFDGWIDDWIETVTIGRRGYLRREWTPWAVSLRLLAWCRYLTWRDAGEDAGFERRFRRACYRNALFLSNHVEWDVGGNHLVENGAALVTAGVLFEEESWVRQGTSILTDAAGAQFLDDGCHFERSTMYHVVVLTRYLTVCHLLDADGRSVPDALRRTAADATEFLRYLRPPDGEMPLLNDAVHGQGLTLPACLRYAEAVGVEAADPGWTGPVSDASPVDASGYLWQRTDAGALLFDARAVGPPHLPGHSHSDTLSVLLWVDGDPVLTDTGTAGYVSGDDRSYARGVRGHNTVQVGETEPITLAGKYLMGSRPTPRARVHDGEVALCEGVYEAAPHRGPAYSHHRAVYAGADWWFLRDTVSGHEGAPTRARFHLHPDVGASIDDRGRVVLSHAGGEAYCTPLEAARPGLTSGPYFPRFGVEQQRQVVEMVAADASRDPLSMSYLFSLRDAPSIRLETATDHSEGPVLQIDDERHSLPAVRLTPE